MAVAALAGLVSFASVAFGWRVWRQRQRTGETGLSGSGRMFPGVLVLVALLGIALVVVGLQLHVRLVEEPYLERVHGQAYRYYMSKAGRFVLWLGRVG